MNRPATAVRFDGPEKAALQARCKEKGVTLSEAMRKGAVLFLDLYDHIYATGGETPKPV